MASDDQLQQEPGAQSFRKPGFFTLRAPSRFEMVFLVILTLVAAPSVFNLARGECNQLTWAGVLCWLVSISVAVLWVLNLSALLRDRVGRHRA
ncbi:hypothetical protein HLB23_14675 [Nocardia uniformis]|uniref:Uncharacterized protein n=1 Tax=Nocardia uniformis TaxID=53432 RepID=A0A849C427_9NOCA|nr:hypothetical protein [Nocardia uniformis]NNH71095.1 hypothetical protein [Nocardia uniformis]